MKTEIRYSPPEITNQALVTVIADVIASLESIKTEVKEFVINDTNWFAKQGQNITPTVVNSAKYITGLLKDSLDSKKGWKTEKTLCNQKIDGYVELYVENSCRINRKNLLNIINKIWISNSDIEPDKLFSHIYQMYYKRKCFNTGKELQKYKKLFDVNSKKQKIRFGLEFETGNIASSFRAFSKLNSLFEQNKIDAGIFITSKDKDTTSCKIWPPSNRNGSFEELESRDYRRNIKLPLFEISFCPDKISKNAPYLGENKDIYRPISTGKVLIFNNIKYDLYNGYNGKEIFKLSL